MASNITGRLLDAVRVQVPGGYVIEGDVYEDVRRRFCDGDRITTSLVKREDGPIILTEFSIYEVEGWRAGT